LLDWRHGPELTRRKPLSAAPRPLRLRSLVLGVPVGGDLDWMKGGWFTYPAPMLGRHLVLIGASNTGKTETSKRLAYEAAKVYGWRVFYLDCKGDSGTAAEFLDAMRAAGCDQVTLFPDASRRSRPRSAERGGYPDVDGQWSRLARPVETWVSKKYRVLMSLVLRSLGGHMNRVVVLLLSYLPFLRTRLAGARPRRTARRLWSTERGGLWHH